MRTIVLLSIISLVTLHDLHTQILKDSEVEQFAQIRLDINNERPDPQQIALRAIKELSLTSDDVQRILTPDATLNAEDKQNLTAIRAYYQQEQDKVAQASCKRRGIDVHRYYQMDNLYQRDGKFQELVATKMSELTGG